MPPRIRFLFVRPAFCFGLPSDSPSREPPLPSASTSPCRACRGLSPPSHSKAPPLETAPVRRCAPCLAHKQKGRPKAALVVSYRQPGYPLGPSRNQMISPSSGKNSSTRIHSSLASPPAELLATLTMAQMTMISQIRPSRPPTSIPIRPLLVHCPTARCRFSKYRLYT